MIAKYDLRVPGHEWGKKRWRFGTGFGRGKWTSQLGLYFTLSIMLLSTRVAVIPFAYRWRTWNLAATLFFCAHCRVVFSLCTSGPTDSHFISHSKLDIAAKWALPLGLLSEFYWTSGTTRIVHLFRRLSSCRRGWPNHIARVGEGGRSYILGTHYGLTGIFFPQE